MSKFEQFLTLTFSLRFFGFLVLSAFITGLFAVATNLYETPRGWKTGVMSTIAFIIGAGTTFYLLK